MAIEFQPSHLDSYLVQLDIGNEQTISLGGLIKEYTLTEPDTYYFTPSGLVMSTEEVLAVHNKLKELNRA
jgi:hypothetical protein